MPDIPMYNQFCIYRSIYYPSVFLTIYLSIYVSPYLCIQQSVYLFIHSKKLCISKTGIELIFIISSLEVQFSTEHPWPPQACPILPIPPLEVSIPPLGRNIPHFGNPWAIIEPQLPLYQNNDTIIIYTSGSQSEEYSSPGEEWRPPGEECGGLGKPWGTLRCLFEN